MPPDLGRALVTGASALASALLAISSEPIVPTSLALGALLLSRALLVGRGSDPAPTARVDPSA